jgi:catechol 2,3-dioxygenase-like lactoylglutathione lyase family enzyme
MNEKQFNKTVIHLPVNNLDETLAYYKNILGFYDEWTFGNKDGGIRRDNMRLLFYEDPEHVTLINSQKHRLAVLWFVDNIEDVYAEFKERNIEIISSLKQHPYDLLEFAFIDVNGYYIRVAEKIDQKELPAQ